MNNRGYLFCNYNLRDLLESKKQDLLRKIDNEQSEYLANVNVDNYLEYLYNEFEMQLPIIDEDNIVIDQHEGKVERYNPSYTYINYVDGVVMYILIPYQGDKNLFLAKPSQYTTSFPMANINEQFIVIEMGLSISEVETYNINEILKTRIDCIKNYLSYIDNDIKEFNKKIKEIAKERIIYKTNNYKKICKMNSTLKYKINRNLNAPLTYKVPNITKRIKLQRPDATSKQIIPEPEVAINIYNDIIEICSNMAKVMERSPKDFANMKEETIRSHFLVQLNGQYEGQATGETFNSNGKTDILIRNDNQNVFIAECKFWKGKKGYLSTIDQLLGYVTYRDTKTAIFMFVKNKNFTEVFQQMKKTVTEHPNFIKFINSYTPPQDSSAFRCEFKNQNDKEKHFYITIMAFCIPNVC